MITFWLGLLNTISCLTGSCFNESISIDQYEIDNCLVKAIAKNDMVEAQLYLSQGARLNGGFLKSPMELALKKKNATMVKTLFEHAKINQQCKQYFATQALTSFISLTHQSYRVGKNHYLYQQQIKNDQNQENSDIQIIKFLLEQGAHVNNGIESNANHFCSPETQKLLQSYRKKNNIN